ncbi:MAG: hypothetical protein DRJ03_06945 [Chloroflexi bacterium]|nr:MAG: hypothetical protein DRJ03_06945 [Chloroflexota bacterium]
MKQTNGNALPLSPTVGDVFFRDDNTVHFCFVDGVWESIGGGGGGADSRIYYDTASAGYRNGRYPYDTGQFNQTNASSAPRLVSNWSQFEDCFFDIENYSQNTTSTHSFPLKQDYVDWKNANMSHSGSPDHFEDEHCLKAYDVVDGNIPVVDRVYGMNNAYSGAKGGKYKGFPNHMGHNGSFAQAVMYAVWANWWPALAGVGFTIADFGGGQQGRHACWTSSNSNKLYSMPKVGEIVTVGGTPGGSSNRQSGNENWEGWNDVDQGDNRLTIVNRLFVLINESASTWQFCSYATNEDAKIINGHLLDGSNNTAFTVFQLVGPGPTGDRQIATLWKPMGIDRIWLPYFDNTKYEMELVYQNDVDAQPFMFRKVNWSEFNSGSGSSPHPNSGMFLRKSNWIPVNTRYLYNLWHVGTANKFKIYFRLRDLTTRKVGKLSAAHIDLRIGETNAPTKLIVRQDRNV